ncbi:hypothetical protein SASPL_135886 [Salvia splendens]|uniref:Uncharacterized protein n=1 Tax=Salvia splendens TaxID=180675 RepID=A0A8X8WYS7_SALSN|nr:uncharacterized protein LOC121761573 [Salvia splendens]KAG6403658.1 hypothetical protein SASPL_135886 [Salvia splendens]
MALSPLRSKFLHHNRSLSLPSKSSPSSSHLDVNISGFEASCSSLSSMESSIKGLKNLYTSIDNLLLLPHIQQIISRDEWIDQVLDGYIRLLDASSTARDLISSTKQHVQELLSALRRKDADGIRCYLSSTKKSKKIIQKSLKSFRSKSIVATVEKGSEAWELVQKLSDAESITVATLESLLAYLIGGRMQSGWSLVAKLMHSKKESNYFHGANEFEKMEALLQISLEGVQVEEVMTLSKEVDSSIQNLEQELECLFRQLIRTRVLLLNILNH